MKAKKIKSVIVIVSFLIQVGSLLYFTSCKKVPDSNLSYLKLLYDSIGSLGNFSLVPQGKLTTDEIAPSPGNLGSLTSSEKKAISVKLNWTKATDNVSYAGDLEYKVVFSTSSNIGKVEEMETIGGGRITSLDWTKNISLHTVTGLTVNTQYYFNVLVRDVAGNKAVYSVTNATTPIIYDNMDGTITDSSRSLTWMKCSVGQVWNATANDCTGAGSPGDNYGIEYYQYCSTNDNACNNTGSPNWEMNGSGFSIAWNKCDNLVLAGRNNWKVPTQTELITLYNSIYSLPAYQPLFPSVGNGFYWTSSADSTIAYFLHPNPEQRAWVVHFGTGVTFAYIGTSEGLKTNMSFLRCVADGL